MIKPPFLMEGGVKFPAHTAGFPEEEVSFPA
jgi:hypothetical protein